jgi:alginate O-acetyltransferase complex protein AlgI
VQATAFPSALLRILKGYFKCIVLSKILSTIQQDLYAQSVQDGQAHILLATLACIGFLATLYANFSGYSDVVIGIARLFGISLPENFHKTFSARNFLDIWSGWHMSMSQWFKTYLFNPTVKALATRWPNLALIPWYGVAGYFLTFFIMGVWHGSTLAFCIYGLILGFGASTNKAYQELLKRYVPKKKLNKLRANFWYCAVSRGAAYSYFSLGLACFWLNTQQLGPFVQAFGGWYGIANAFLLATAIFAVVFELFDYVPERLRAVETFTV